MADIQTPVSFVIENRLIYIRSDRNSGKIKRARNNLHVCVPPCSARGFPKSEWVDGQLRMESTSESNESNSFSRISTSYKVRSLEYSIY